MTAAYVLVIAWFVSHLICLYIVRRRNVRIGLLHKLLAVILGPFAIPLAFVVGSKSRLPEA